MIVSQSEKKMFLSTKIYTPLLFILIICSSCQNKKNKIEIETIEELEQITLTDINILKSINTNHIKNNIKLSKLNVLKLEEKELDSISVEFIYFEYREYLNYINQTTTIINSLNNLKNTLAINQKQLNTLKLDYSQSKNRRYDLDEYLKNEKIFVQTTSQEINKINNILTQLNAKFDTLNKKIELIIYED